MKERPGGLYQNLGHVIGYHSHQDPCSMLIVQPTVAGLSRVEDSFQKSSPGYFVLTCPDCGLEHVRGFETAEIKQPRIEAEIGGWGVGEEAWSIDHLILPGDLVLGPVLAGPCGSPPCFAKAARWFPTSSLGETL
ncbi:phage terminase large subunit family protein [Methylohalobius crimeensis]|uniref:phage terminase large subunit family protein n=1 Tax=Methylohalobius crimeensis TaxID=244365 RepID=UPI0003B3ADE9|nr:phage terminase large subunit family protein [Methylohalobius crimeensis]